jgi:uncharacterized membrane protein YciS (DUF1049 family)
MSFASIFAIGFAIAYAAGGLVYAHVVIPTNTRLRVARMAAEVEEEAAREEAVGKMQ